jgi:hypothetical protein
VREGFAKETINNKRDREINGSKRRQSEITIWADAPADIFQGSSGRITGKSGVKRDPFFNERTLKVVCGKNTKWLLWQFKAGP